MHLFHSIILQSTSFSSKLKSFDFYMETLEQSAVHYGPRIIVGIIALSIGLWLIRKLSHGLTTLLMARNVDKSLVPFVRSVLSIFLKATLILSVLSFMGFNTTSFITALGAVGLAVARALQGSLSNFAGGVLILMFKPFRVGDFIEAGGHKGSVREIQILYTTIITPENKKVVIPNGTLSNKDVINYTAEDNRRIDLKIPVAHGSNIMEAKKILQSIVDSDEKILKDPKPVIGVHEITSSGINIDFLFWVKRIYFGEVQYSVYEKIALEFEKAKISFTTDSTEIHVHTGTDKED